MKRLGSIVVLFAFVYCQSRGQSNYVFPMYGDSVTWNVLETYWGNGGTDVFKYEYDTSFCGQTYSMVALDGYYSVGKLYLRSSGERVLGRYAANHTSHNMSCSDSERLAYDFSLKKSDSVEIYHQNVGLIYVHVDSVYFAQVNGIYRKHLRISNYTNTINTPSFTWIQGIGTNEHPFYFVYDYGGGSEVYLDVLCIDSASTNIYLDQHWMTCDTVLFLGVTELNSRQNCQLFPNPVNEVLHIKCDLPMISYTIYNSVGKVASQGKSENNIGVEELEPGIYFIVLQTKEGSFFSRFIISR